MPAQSTSHLWTLVGVVTACAGNGLDSVAVELAENWENSFLGQLGCSEAWEVQDQDAGLLVSSESTLPSLQTAASFLGSYCLFIFIKVSFTVKKLLSLIKSHLFICLYCHYFRRWIQKDIGVIYVNECPAYVFL